MARQQVIQDTQPLSGFRAEAASLIRQINETKRPIVITQGGKGIAVVMAVSEYEAMQKKIEFLEKLQTKDSS